MKIELAQCASLGPAELLALVEGLGARPETLEARVTPVGGRERSLTERGFEAVERWIAPPRAWVSAEGAVRFILPGDVASHLTPGTRYQLILRGVGLRGEVAANFAMPRRLTFIEDAETDEAAPIIGAPVEPDAVAAPDATPSPPPAPVPPPEPEPEPEPAATASEPAPAAPREPLAAPTPTAQSSGGGGLTAVAATLAIAAIAGGGWWWWTNRAPTPVQIARAPETPSQPAPEPATIAAPAPVSAPRAEIVAPPTPDPTIAPTPEPPNTHPSNTRPSNTRPSVSVATQPTAPSSPPEPPAEAAEPVRPSSEARAADPTPAPSPPPRTTVLARQPAPPPPRPPGVQQSFDIAEDLTTAAARGEELWTSAIDAWRSVLALPDARPADKAEAGLRFGQLTDPSRPPATNNDSARMALAGYRVAHQHGHPEARGHLRTLRDWLLGPGADTQGAIQTVAKIDALLNGGP